MIHTIHSAIRPRALRLGALLCLAAAPGVLAACDDPAAAAPAAALDVRGPDPYVELGATLPLTATVTDAQGGELGGRRVTWESSNPGVASVQDGVVTGRALGKATIRATSGSVADSVVVTVEPAVGSIVVLPTATTMGVGVTVPVSVFARPPANNENLQVTFRWSTANPAVAVADSGRVRGVGVGTTEVIVAAGSRTERFTVEVVRPYTVTRIALPGETDGRAHAINSTGTVVGQSVVGGRSEAWRWQNGTLTPLGEGRALDVNDAGTVVGGSGAEAVMWKDGAKTVLFSREGGFAWAEGVNARGEAVGAWMGTMGCGPGGRCPGSAWVHSGGTARDIVSLGTNPTANAVSDAGVVVGSDGSDVRQTVYSFVYRDGALTQLPGQDGKIVARDVNERGEIVGGGAYAPAVRWASPQAPPTPLPVVSQFQGASGAYAINEAGDVVGFAQNNGTRGVLWRGSRALDLNYLFVDPDWTLEYALDINDRGQIVGYGKHRTTGATGALLLTPAQ